MGIRAANCTPKTGNVIGMHIVYGEKGDVVLASQKGQFIRMELKNIKRLGRDTQGVTLMRLRENDKVSSVALILPDETINEQPKMDFDDNTPKLEKIEKTLPQKDEPKKKISVEPELKINNYKSSANDESEESVKKPADSIVKKEVGQSIMGDHKPINSMPGKAGLNVKFYDNKIVVDKSADGISSKKSDSVMKKDDKNYWGKV